MQATLKLEDFGSKGLLRILGCIYQYGPLNMGTLTRRTGINHGNVGTYLKKLVEYGLVKERKYGKMGMRMLRLGHQQICIHIGHGMKSKIELSS